MKKVFISILLFVASSHCLAGSGWSQRGKIIEIYNHGYTVMVKMSGENKDYTDTCSSTVYYAINTADAKSFDIKFSQLLMLHASGKEAQLWIDGNTCSGQGSNYQTIGTIKSFQ